MDCSFYNGQANAYWFLFLAVSFFLCATCVAQPKKTAALEPTFRTLHDAARTDNFNQLSAYYITTEKQDSAVYYAHLAYEEAKAGNDMHGLAVSLSRQSQIAKHFDDDFIKSETLAKAALQWFEKTPNKAGIDTLYNQLIYTLLAQSRFSEALAYAQKHFAVAQQTGNQWGMMNALGWKFALHRQSGDYEKSFMYAQQRYDLALNAKNKIWIMDALYSLAQLYMLIEDYPHALYYFHEVLRTDDNETRRERIVTDNDIWFKMEFTEVFSHLGRFDSAWHYYKLFKPSPDKAVYLRVYWVSTGECYLLQKNYVQALQNFKLGLAAHLKLNDRNEVMRTLLDLGKTQLALNNNAKAIGYGKLGLNMALQNGAKQFIRDGFQILATVYDRLHQSDSANFYFRQYAQAKEAVLNDQARGKLAAYKYEQQIALISKEKEIQQVLLHKESFVKEVLIWSIVFLFLLGVALLRNIALKRRAETQRLEHQIALQKAESERTTAEFQQRAAELQMQALRAQMNPHFIFNSLNSINDFILQNNRKQASEYLTKFSRLVRLILQNAQATFILLESELDALQLYLELEALRFDHHFSYNLSLAEDLDVSVLKVPPLIIQPYVENAVWHGLMHKDEKGHLEISIRQQDKVLYCTITDNGIGRKKAMALKSGAAPAHKSMGMQITADRMAMLEQNESTNAYITINDLTLPDGRSGGTEVILKIPVHDA